MYGHEVVDDLKKLNRLYRDPKKLGKIDASKAVVDFTKGTVKDIRNAVHFHSDNYVPLMDTFGGDGENFLFWESTAEVIVPGPICWFDFKIPPEDVMEYTIGDAVEVDPCYRRGVLMKKLPSNVLKLTFFGYYTRDRAWMPSSLVTFVRVGGSFKDITAPPGSALARVLSRVEKTGLKTLDGDKVPAEGTEVFNMVSSSWNPTANQDDIEHEAAACRGDVIALNMLLILMACSNVKSITKRAHRPKKNKNKTFKKYAYNVLTLRPVGDLSPAAFDPEGVSGKELGNYILEGEVRNFDGDNKLDDRLVGKFWHKKLDTPTDECDIITTT